MTAMHHPGSVSPAPANPPGRVDRIRAAAASDRSPRLTVVVSNRDRAVLRAVADGRCAVSSDCGNPLTIDGVCLADQFVGSRLGRAGLIAAIGPAPARAVLTEAGRAVLAA